jgi:hypothetical protein
MLTWTERATFVQHVGGLVNPTPLVPGDREGLLDCLPEAERAITDREVRRDLEPTLLDVDEELAPALRTFSNANLEADKLLLALRRGTDQHQHTLGVVFHPGLQIDPVRPHIHNIAAPRGRASARRRNPPATAPSAGDHGWRQVRRVLAQEGGERLLKVAGRDAAQIKDWQQRVEALGPPENTQ